MQTLDINQINISSGNLNFLELRNLMNKSSNTSYIGSDEHLDLINEINDYLDLTIDQVSNINEFVENNFPTNKEFAEILVKNLIQLYGGLNIGLSMLESNDNSYKSHESRINAFKEEVDQIQEFILDIQRFILNKSEDIIELDNFLKSM